MEELSDLQVVSLSFIVMMNNCDEDCSLFKVEMEVSLQHIDLCLVQHSVQAYKPEWSSGMIPPLGGGGPGFKSPFGPFLVFLLFLFSVPNRHFYQNPSFIHMIFLFSLQQLLPHEKRLL